MNRLLVVVALVVTALLAGVLYELHGLNRRLDYAAARNWGLPVAAPRGALPAYKPETDAERRARRRAEIDRAVEDLEHGLSQPSAGAAGPRRSR